MQLDVRGPSRFFTVEACTAGGSVAVEVIQEGSLRLATGGGSISVPKVRLLLHHQRSACPRGPGCSALLGTTLGTAPL